MTKLIKKGLGLLPKKIGSLSSKQQKLLKAAIASSAALSFAGCGGGSGGSGGGTAGVTQALALNLINDVTVKEGGTITLSPSVNNANGQSLTFSYSGYMTTATKQTTVGDAGVYFVQVRVSDGSRSATQNVKVIIYSGTVTTQAAHLVRRTTFGMTPTLFREIDALGAQGFLDQQLDPTTIDDSAFTKRMASVVTTTRAELRAWSLLNMIYSKRQLLEVMTWFWDNHFNTDIRNVHNNRATRDLQYQIERSENNAFRTNALGNFRQLLEVSSKGPSMLLFLNNVQNRKSDSNENYARELLELHTMGVNGGYTHLDIEAGAEIFTGWQLQGATFFFNAAQHNDIQQTYLGNTIAAGGGVTQGEQVLDILASHVSTAQFVCSKLITLLVNDTPPQTLIDRCATTFQAAVNDPDQIAQVLRIILTSAEFNAPANNLAKIKSPVEFVTSVARALEGESTAQRLQRHVANIGIELYENPWPTGWSEKGSDWMSSGLLLERMKAAEDILRLNHADNLQQDLLAFFPAHGVTTADGIVDFLLVRLLGEYPAVARQNAINFLNGTTGFNLTNRNARNQLRYLLEIIVSYPQFQYQ